MSAPNSRPFAVNKNRNAESNMPNLATYEEFVPAQRRRAVESDLAAIARDEEVIKTERKNVETSVLKIAKAIVRQGEALQRICGHEQITFPFVRALQERLPWGDDPRKAFEIARKRVAATCKVEGRISNLDDLSPEARRHVLQQIELLAVCERPQLTEAETADSHDPILFFVSDALRLKQSLQKCWRDKPMEQHSKAQLRDFLSSTQWLADERERATTLLRR